MSILAITNETVNHDNSFATWLDEAAQAEIDSAGVTTAYAWGAEDAQNNLPCSPELYVANANIAHYVAGYLSVKPNNETAQLLSKPSAERQANLYNESDAWTVEWERAKEVDAAQSEFTDWRI